MKALANVTVIAGLAAGVISSGLLVGGWWGLALYSLVAAGILLIIAAALGAATGSLDRADN
jgi:hypothetical protein